MRTDGPRGVMRSEIALAPFQKGSPGHIKAERRAEASPNVSNSHDVNTTLTCTVGGMMGDTGLHGWEEDGFSSKVSWRHRGSISRVSAPATPNKTEVRLLTHRQQETSGRRFCLTAIPISEDKEPSQLSHQMHELLPASLQPYVRWPAQPANPESDCETASWTSQ
jgi:hypothetical protein